MFGRGQPPHGRAHVVGTWNDRLRNAARPQDVGEEKTFDVLDLCEKSARRNAVLDQLIRVPSAPLDQLVEKILPHGEKITDPLRQLRIQLLTELSLKIEHRLPGQIEGPGSLLLVDDEPVLHLRDLFLEALDDVGDVSGLGEILGNVGPPAGDAAPLAVGLELAAG